MPQSSMIWIAVLIVWTPSEVTGAAPLLEDNVYIRTDIVGRPDTRIGWADSYSDGDSCYCASNFDHNITTIKVDTPLGVMNISQICALLGDGPSGSKTGHPVYNDIQCGNGPPNNAGDEDDCPGRTEYGQEGCKYIGPKWNFKPFLPPTKAPVSPPRPVPTPKAPPVSPPRPVPTPKAPPVSPPKAPPVSTPRAAPVPPPVPASAVLLCRDFVRFEGSLTAGDANIRTNSYDSYSVGGECYCRSTMPDASIGDTIVKVPPEVRQRTGTTITQLQVKEICQRLGPGPGSQGRPLYNDIQCGNGPPSTSAVEVTCPGRVEYGAEGCKFLGPQWNWDRILQINLPAPTAAPVVSLCLDWVRVRPVIVLANRTVSKSWASSYSVGDECYCQTNYANGIGDVRVPVPADVISSTGTSVTSLTVREICTRLGPGPGSQGRPIYNDIQCGNGPRNTGNERDCPGRTEYGVGGCNFLGPRWNWVSILSS
jgi:hypothetical protein